MPPHPRARCLARPLLAAGLLVLAACGGPPPSGHGAATPEALIQKLASGWARLDPATVRSCLDTDGEDGRRVAGLLAAGLDTLRAKQAFAAAVRDRFGGAFAEAWFGPGLADPAAFLTALADLPGRTRIHVDGDRATVEVLRRGAPIPGVAPARLVRRSGVWRFAVAPYLPEDPNLCDNVTHILNAFRDGYRAGKKAVAAAGDRKDFEVRMKRIYAELDAAVREAMQVVQPFLERDRFDHPGAAPG